MKQLDTNQLRHSLRTVVDNVELALRDMSDATGERAGDLKSSAGRHLRDARAHLDDMERHGAAQVHRAGRHAQNYARHHPWQVVGGLAAMAFTIAMLSRARH